MAPLPSGRSRNWRPGINPVNAERCSAEFLKAPAGRLFMYSGSLWGRRRGPANPLWSAPSRSRGTSTDAYTAPKGTATRGLAVFAPGGLGGRAGG